MAALNKERSQKVQKSKNSRVTLLLLSGSKSCILAFTSSLAFPVSLDLERVFPLSTLYQTVCPRQDLLGEGEEEGGGVRVRGWLQG